MKKAFVLFLFFSINIIVAQNSDRFSIKNIDVNSKNNEFGVILNGDGSIFYSKSSFDNTKDFNEKSANLYKGVLETKGQFSKGLKFPTDATHAVFTSDGNTVYYSKRNGSKKFQLYRANIDHTGRWKNNTKLPFNDPNYSFKQPALNTDNTKLFFASDLPGSLGKTDIFYVNIINKGSAFSDPIHLGENVNTTGTEIYPFIGEKDKLFFSSDAHNSMGGLDIFESFYEEGKYVNTSNLENPINGPSDDFAYVLIPDTNKGYFSSNRIDGFGGIDIYYFEDRKPSVNKCSQAIKGVVKNKKNKKAIFEASVEVFSSQDHISTVLTNYKGEFLVENVECNERYDIVSYKEGYNGFAEVQTVPEKGKFITLYLDPEFPEEFEEEFDFSNEMVVYDTETNKVVKTETDLQNEETNSDLSFAEKREQDRIKKEKIKRERIEAEEEAERIEAQKKEAIRIAVVEAQRVAAEKDKQERIARAKAMAEKLRLEKEALYKAEEVRIAAENLENKKQQIEEEKALAQEQEARRLAIVKENKEKADAEKLAQVELEKQEKIKNEQLALAEKEKQAEFLAQKQAVEKERLDRIALAQKTAEKLRQEKERTEIAEKERLKKELIAEEKALAVQQESDRQLKAKEAQDKQEADNIAQLELEKEQQLENTRIAQEQNKKISNNKEELAALEAQKQIAIQERLKRIAQAQETANRLRTEQEKANKVQQDAMRLEEERLNKIKQAEAEIVTIQEEKLSANADKKTKEENNSTVTNEVKINKDREKLIALAKKTAEKLRNEQNTAEKETLKRTLLQQERNKKIAEAKETAEKLRVENEQIAKQTNLVELQKTVDNERLERIAQAKATAEKLRKQQTEADNSLAEAKLIDKERALKLAQSEKNLIKLQKEQIAEDKINENENEAEIDEAIIAERNRIKEERKLRIAQAKETAEKIRKEQIEADKAKITRETLKAEREKEIAEAQKVAQTLKEELLDLTKSVAEQQEKQTKKNITDQKFVEANEVAEIESKNDTTEKGQKEIIAKKNLEESYVSSNKTKKDTIDVPEEYLSEQSNITKSNPDRCARDLNGIIQSSTTNETLIGATVDLYFDGQNIESTTTDKKGEFHFYNVDCNTKYTIISFKKDYNNIAKADIDTESVPDIIVLLLDPDVEIPVVEEPIKESIAEEVSDEKPKEAESISNKKPKIVHKEEKDVVVEEVTVSDDNNISQTEKSVTDIVKNEIEEPISPLKSKITEVEVPKIKGRKIQINPIYFDLDEYYLTLPARRELDKIIVILRQNPTMIIESGSHTDTRGDFDYNLKLSEKRSQETVGYLVANGADPDRISGRGYGETMPLNHCVDGVKCSEAEHLVNRRTEFIILRY